MKSKTDFSQLVYQATQLIPFGFVATYQDIARKIGRPAASRAVGNALHHNPTMIVIPCHRVVNAKGRLAKNFGYHGQEGQKKLLESEGVLVENYLVDLSIYRVKELK